IRGGRLLPKSRSRSDRPQLKSNLGHSQPPPLSPPPSQSPNFSPSPVSFDRMSKMLFPLESVSAFIASESLTRSMMARFTAGDSSIGPTFFSQSAVAVSTAFV